jgi:hypothetical protein
MFSIDMKTRTRSKNTQTALIAWPKLPLGCYVRDPGWRGVAWVEVERAKNQFIKAVASLSAVLIEMPCIIVRLELRICALGPIVFASVLPEGGGIFCTARLVHRATTCEKASKVCWRHL